MKHTAKLSTLLLLAASTYAVDNNLSVNFQGRLDVSVGANLHNNKNPTTKMVSPNHRDVAINSLAGVWAILENKLDNGITYGAKIGLETTSRNDRRLPTALFFESESGRWEFGSEKSALHKMKITNFSNAAATGGIWDMWVSPDPESRNIAFATSFGGFLDTKTRNSNIVEYSRKITYYTPLYSGFQFGISYVPDTTNSGRQAFNLAESHKPVVAQGNKYETDIKDGIALGLTYVGEFNNGARLNNSIVAEFGKPVPGKELLAAHPGIKLKKLKAYTVGSEFTYEQVSVVGAYSNYNKSLTAPELDGNARDTSMYGFGVRYKAVDIPLTTSIHSYHSDCKKNTVDAFTLGVDYQIAPNLLPYAEITHYNAKGSYKDKKGQKQPHSLAGNLFLVGMRLSF